MSYDPAVYELTRLFLSDVPEKDTEQNRQWLAQHIQNEIEDWIEFVLLPTVPGEAERSPEMRSPEPSNK